MEFLEKYFPLEFTKSSQCLKRLCPMHLDGSNGSLLTHTNPEILVFKISRVLRPVFPCAGPVPFVRCSCVPISSVSVFLCFVSPCPVSPDPSSFLCPVVRCAASLVFQVLCTVFQCLVFLFPCSSVSVSRVLCPVSRVLCFMSLSCVT